VIEWTCDPKREPLYVSVTWTDACIDGSFSCALVDAGKRAQLQHGRNSDGRLIYIRTEGRDARLVLASLYDAPGVADDEAWVENFMIIPWLWVERIRVIRGPVIYSRDIETPKVRSATARARRTKGQA
jgi:hypothetical protein